MSNLQLFLTRQPMFEMGIVVRIVVRKPNTGFPKAHKWAHMLPDAHEAIAKKQAEVWDVAYADGSKSAVVLRWGFLQHLAVGATAQAAICHQGRIKGLHALQHKQLGVPLHIVTDSELVFLGLTRKCEKWHRYR